MTISELRHFPELIKLCSQGRPHGFPDGKLADFHLLAIANMRVLNTAMKTAPFLAYNATRPFVQGKICDERDSAHQATQYL